MRSLILFSVALVLTAAAPGPEKTITHIQGLMDLQEAAWNRGDIDAFMEPYWHSEELTFIGKNGVTKGWQQTLDNYKKSYPDKAAMGNLTFTNLHMEQVGKKSVYVVGKWHLAREAGDLEGHYTLMWKRMGGEWVIVSDHSS